MSWSRQAVAGRAGRGGRARIGAARLAACAAALAWLGACGFVPLYGTARYDILPQLATIKVNPIADRIGQQLRNRLADLLTPKGEPKRPRYTLDVQLSVGKINLGIQEDETVTRANLVVHATYTLRALPGGEKLDSGISRSTTSYDIVESDFATVIAEADAERRALDVIGDNIAMRLSFYFSRQRREGS